MRKKRIDMKRSMRVGAIGMVMVLVVATLAVGLVSCAGDHGVEQRPLKVGIVGEPTTFNPFADGSFTFPSMFVFYNFYDELYIYGPDPSHVHEPWLATGYTWETVGDRTEVTVSLREDVTWWDGEPFTADDVVFTSNLVMNCKFTLWYISYVYQGELFVEAVEKVDTHTVKYTLTEPVWDVFDRLLQQMVVPKHQWQPVLDEAIGLYGEDWGGIAEYIQQTEFAPGEWIGNGPFKLVEYESGLYLILEANEDYWRKGMTIDYDGDTREIGPWIDEMEVRLYGTTDTAILALQTGQIDYVYANLPPAKVPQLEEDPDIEVAWVDWNGYYAINFNQRTMPPGEELKWPMCDREFRIAVAHLADKDFLVDTVALDYGEPVYSFVPYGMTKWYNPDVTRHGEGLSEVERLYAAYQVLKSANYTWETEPVFTMDGGTPIELTTPGSGLKLPDSTSCPTIRLGRPLTSEDPVCADIASFMIGWMTKIGIPVVDRPMDTWTGFQAGLEGDWEMNIWLSRFGAVNMMEIQCLHSTQRPKIAGWLGYNSGAWINEEFDALADAFIEETDYTAKKALIDQAQELVAVEVPWLTLWSPKRIEAYRTDRYEDWYVQPLYGVNNDVGHWNWLVVKPVE